MLRRHNPLVCQREPANDDPATGDVHDEEAIAIWNEGFPRVKIGYVPKHWIQTFDVSSMYVGGLPWNL